MFPAIVKGFGFHAKEVERLRKVGLEISYALENVEKDKVRENLQGQAKKDKKHEIYNVYSSKVDLF